MIILLCFLRCLLLTFRWFLIIWLEWEVRVRLYLG